MLGSCFNFSSPKCMVKGLLLQIYGPDVAGYPVTYFPVISWLYRISWRASSVWATKVAASAKSISLINSLCTLALAYPLLTVLRKMPSSDLRSAIGEVGKKRCRRVCWNQHTSFLHTAQRDPKIILQIGLPCGSSWNDVNIRRSLGYPV